jgi:hypothetical protein
MPRKEELDTKMSTYPSKRDWWLMVILWSLAPFFIFIALTVHKEPVALWMKVFATCVCGILALLTIALVVLPYFTSYSLDPVNLTIKIGPFSKKIPIAEITEAFPTWNPLSAPAWSLDRLRIRFSSSKFGALISPVKKLEFLEELNRHAPHLERKGNRLIRSDT